MPDRRRATTVNRRTSGAVKPETARYSCEGCGVLLEEHQKTEMLAKGTWVPANEGASCDDDDTCSAGDVCAAGVCGGTLPDCALETIYATVSDGVRTGQVRCSVVPGAAPLCETEPDGTTLRVTWDVPSMCQ